MTPNEQIVSLSGPMAGPIQPGSDAPASILERNLAALRRSSPELEKRLRAVRPSESVNFIETPDGALSAVANGRALASKRRPLEEARRLAESVDIKRDAVFAVLGFGLGHHVAAVAERVGRTGVTLCFEPDLPLLRAVLERVDHSPWLGATNTAIVCDPADAGALSSVINGIEGLVAMGVRLIEHPASMERLGASAHEFGATLSRVVAAVRTSVLTTMVQTETTVRNLAMNADRYAAAPGIEDLHNALQGSPAVVVSAGPSLSRNIHLLAQPGVRDRVCIVAVQTTLKPLLAAGVRPHFVVALDHHEISRRFYEGLTASDVEGVTLVVEPKANPAIIDAWPGAVRMPRDAFLDTLLGDGLTDPNRGAIKAGATVAHLAHYLARHLGCDPVAFIGQDLGFTDNQYYAADAAIHRVWAGELNEFVSLELLEWQRIARTRSTLRKVEDVFGNPVYTDEQMATYLAQFERDFLADANAGLRVIDATEGGARKMHAVPSTLAAFLAEHATRELPALPSPHSNTAASGAPRVVSRLREVRQGVWRVARSCSTTHGVLTQMLEHHQDQERVNRLITQAQRLAEETREIGAAYELTQHFNQAGVFNRARADRSIALDDLDPLARQRRQIERDAKNVEWLRDAAESFGAVLDRACAAIQSGVRPARDFTAPTANPLRTASDTTSNVAAVLLVGPSAFTEIAGRPALSHTLERLARCARLDSVALVTDDPESVNRVLESTPGLPTPTIVTVDSMLAAAAKTRTLAGRAWAPSCWRGGLGGLTIYDELIDPRVAALALERVNADATLLIGADWPLLDPALCDEVIARHEESPEHHRLVFTQAPPGLCGCVVDAALLREIAEGADKGGAFASIGGVLAYNPRSPKADPIAKPICVQINPAVRDLQRRFTCDSAHGVSLCQALVDHAADSSALASAMESCTVRSAGSCTATLIIDDRTSADDALAAIPVGVDAVTIDARSSSDRGLLASILDALRSRVPHIHVRIEPSNDPREDGALLAHGPSVVSVEMHADSAEAYAAATGHDGFAAALKSLEALASAVAGIPYDKRPWIVPRMTKRDEAVHDVESFVDKWTLVFGHAALDPRTDAPDSARIRALPLPPAAAARFVRERRVIDLREPDA